MSDTPECHPESESPRTAEAKELHALALKLERELQQARARLAGVEQELELQHVEIERLHRVALEDEDRYHNSLAKLGSQYEAALRNYGARSDAKGEPYPCPKNYPCCLPEGHDGACMAGPPPMLAASGGK